MRVRCRAGLPPPGGPASRGRPSAAAIAASTSGPSNGASASTARRRTAGLSWHASRIVGSASRSPSAPSAATAASRANASRWSRAMSRQRGDCAGRDRACAQLADRPRRGLDHRDVGVVEQDEHGRDGEARSRARARARLLVGGRPRHRRWSPAATGRRRRRARRAPARRGPPRGRGRRRRCRRRARSRSTSASERVSRWPRVASSAARATGPASVTATGR